MGTAAKPRPIAAELFEDGPDGPRLIGGRRKSDGRIVFPLPQGIARADFEPVRLARDGRLWSFTVQRFRPKSPPYAGADDERTFRPFVLGYVELPGEVIVETRIAVEEPVRLKIGMPMRLVLAPFAHQSGEAVVTYAFEPVAKS